MKPESDEREEIEIETDIAEEDREDDVDDEFLKGMEKELQQQEADEQGV